MRPAHRPGAGPAAQPDQGKQLLSADPGAPGTARAQPFYCPYCSEEDFVPFGEEPGRFFCNSCTRHFSVHFLGLGRRGDETEQATERANPTQ